MQERDRSAEPKTDEQVKRRNWIKEAERHAVDLQLCLAQAMEEEDPAAKLQPLGSDIVAFSRFEEGDPPWLTLVLPEWPPKLRPHEAGPFLWAHTRDVRRRWETMVQRALEAGGLGDFQPRWSEATILFTYRVPQANPGDADHFAHTFIINALRKFGVIEDDGWHNVTIGGVRALPAVPSMSETVVTVVKGHHWFGDSLIPPIPLTEENPFTS